MPFEDWLKDLMDRAKEAGDEGAIIAPTSYGVAYDRGQYDAYQKVFTAITREIANARIEPL